MNKDFQIAYILYLADTALILSHRNSEWCGHGPILEQDIAITNISLDLLGQARLLYQHAAALLNDGSTEDSLAYLRNERDFKNLLLVELPREDWGFTIGRQFLFSQFQQLLFQQLQYHADVQLAAIAAKSLKEINYHIRWSKEWVIRLGDGTTISRQKITEAIDQMWSYTGEMFVATEFEQFAGINLNNLHTLWEQQVQAVWEEATLPLPAKTYMHTGGKQGVHTEHLGFLLAEMQYLQRSFPGVEW